jgi:hypothetical protein
MCLPSTMTVHEDSIAVSWSWVSSRILYSNGRGVLVGHSIPSQISDKIESTTDPPTCVSYYLQ